MSHAVLIVDDEQHILQSLKRLLRRDGYEVHLADGGPAALEILADTEIAVIICDQRMPGMMGAEVLARAYKLHPDTVRITLTGYTDLAAAQASINEGHVSHFLLKPWENEHLRAVVRQGVEAYALVRENRRLEALTLEQRDKLQAWNQRLEQQVQDRTEELREQNENLLQLQRRVEQSLRDTVGVLAGTLEAFSPNLGIHCKRVAQLARQLATQLGLDDQAQRDVELAAHLHDLGKLSRVASEAPAEGRRLRTANSPHLVRHTEAGYAILSKVSGFERIALAVRHQQEQFDGSGLPDGLKKDGIPLASRIIAVTNAYDKAVFGAASPTDVAHEAGLEILHAGRGKRFDPSLVDQLLRYLDEMGAAADTDAEVELSPKKIKEGMTLSRPIHNHDGILLLKEGTRLTPDLIEHIRSMSVVDPLLTSVFVSCTRGETQDDAQNPDTPQCGTGVSPVESPNMAQATADTAGPYTVAGAASIRDDDKSSLEEASRPHRRDAGATVPGIDPGTNPGPGPGTGTRARPESPGPAQERRSVLVVDDSVLVCNALKRELRRAGIDTVATESGWTAINLVERRRFDVVLVDLMMPAMPGDELVRRLQQCAPTLPCFILTGNATKEHVLSLSKQQNVVGILTKPWDRDRLIAAIEDAIAQSEPELAKGPA